LINHYESRDYFIPKDLSFLPICMSLDSISKAQAGKLEVFFAINWNGEYFISFFFL